MLRAMHSRSRSPGFKFIVRVLSGAVVANPLLETVAHASPIHFSGEADFADVHGLDRHCSAPPVGGGGGSVRAPTLLYPTDEHRDHRADDGANDRWREDAFRRAQMTDQAAGRPASTTHDDAPGERQTVSLPDRDDECANHRADCDPAQERNECHACSPPGVWSARAFERFLLSRV